MYALPESLVADTIEVSAAVPLILAPSYPLHDKPTNPLNGVPITLEAGTDVVVFSGNAYPGSTVSILKNGLIVTKVTTSNQGDFTVSLRDLNPGTYTFGIRSDIDGVPTDLQSFAVFITTGITTMISKILLSPTIAVDKESVRFGDPITFTGKAAPNKDIDLFISSLSDPDTPTLILKTRSSGGGEWAYSLLSTDLSLGTYEIIVRARGKDVTSPVTRKITFVVGDTTKYVIAQNNKKYYCDINGDGYVNLLDFSILAFWYKRFGFPSNVDLNSDEAVNLLDFSILAYCWSG